MTDALPLDGVSTAPTRIVCPCCHRDVALTGTGLIGSHGFSRVGPRNVGRCPSAGLTPSQARGRLADQAERPPAGGAS